MLMSVCKVYLDFTIRWGFDRRLNNSRPRTLCLTPIKGARVGTHLSEVGGAGMATCGIMETWRRAGDLTGRAWPRLWTQGWKITGQVLVGNEIVEGWQMPLLLGPGRIRGFA